MKTFTRGEIWLVDLGLSAKIRPCLILSIVIENNDRSIITIIPHTTSVRGSRFEISIPTKFLKPGAFDVQGIVTITTAYLIRKIGSLSPSQMMVIEKAVCHWLGIN